MTVSFKVFSVFTDLPSNLGSERLFSKEGISAHTMFGDAKDSLCRTL